MLNMLKFFSRSSISAAYKSLAFVPASTIPKSVFRGGLNEFVKRVSEPNEISHVEIYGKKLFEGVYDSSLELDPQQLKNFLNIIAQIGIKHLDFSGCTLTPTTGIIIGNALKTNNTLKELAVTSNQLQTMGMLGIMHGLVENQALKKFYSRSYNIKCYLWSPQELAFLAHVVSVNSVLEEIVLPDNQINDFSDINILAAPYHLTTNRTPPRISGFHVSNSATIPCFCKENLDELDKLSQCRFQNRY